MGDAQFFRPGAGVDPRDFSGFIDVKSQEDGSDVDGAGAGASAILCVLCKPRTSRFLSRGISTVLVRCPVGSKVMPSPSSQTQA